MATVLNEEASIGALLDSILAQERSLQEVVIVDGGSRDGTVAIIQSYARNMPLRLLVEPGCNIARGRNLAIAAAQGDIIAVTDGGVRLSPQWLAHLVSALEEAATTSGVASGFFLPDTRTPFERAMAAATLPSLAEIDPHTFLPSSRSLAFHKEAWQRVGGYPEWLDYCEDLIFDFRLRQAGFSFTFVPSAIAYFRPRSSLTAFFKQYYHYARGDGKADLWRIRHLIRYSAYILALAIFGGGLWFPPLWVLLLVGVFHLYRPYCRLLSLLKRQPLREKLSAILYVPIIRLTGDLAKMAGYPVGLWWRKRHCPRSYQ
ncbi:MAG: glycosyltransferase [Chloroflexi bacterium]|nr:glycosyltransferase [Chloroflexota bacterium]